MTKYAPPGSGVSQVYFLPKNFIKSAPTGITSSAWPFSADLRALARVYSIPKPHSRALVKMPDRIPRIGQATSLIHPW